MVISVCPPLFAFEFACASMRVRRECVCVYIYHKRQLCFCVYLYLCVFMPQAGVVLFLSQSIKQPGSGCSWDDAIRTLFQEARVCVCVCRVRVAADQCGSNHPTGAVWSPITLFKQTAQPDTQTRRCPTDYWITPRPVHHHSVRSHGCYNQIIVNNPVTVIVRLKQSHALQWSNFPGNPKFTWFVDEWVNIWKDELHVLS